MKILHFVYFKGGGEGHIYDIIKTYKLFCVRYNFNMIQSSPFDGTLSTIQANNTMVINECQPGVALMTDL